MYRVLWGQLKHTLPDFTSGNHNNITAYNCSLFQIFYMNIHQSKHNFDVSLRPGLSARNIDSLTETRRCSYKPVLRAGKPQKFSTVAYLKAAVVYRSCRCNLDPGKRIGGD